MRNVTEFQNFAAWFNLHIDLVRFVNHNPQLETAQKDAVYDMLLCVLEMQTKFFTLGVASEKTDFSQQKLPGLYQLIAPTESEKRNIMALSLLHKYVLMPSKRWPQVHHMCSRLTFNNA